MSKLFEALHRAGPAATGSVPPADRNTALIEALTPTVHGKGSQNGHQGAQENGNHAISETRKQIRTIPVRLGEPAIFPFDQANASAAEQYRMIRTKIAYARPPGSIITLSSATAGDGKTITALNIAAALALKNDANIVLVDGDLCRATVAGKLGIPQSPGLVDFLQGHCQLEEVIIRLEQIPNLYIVPAGEAGQKRTELLESPRWKALVSLFRRQFAYTIIDAPPIGVVADYELLQAAGDAVVMVVRPDHTERPLCLNAIATIPKEKLLGVVFNAADKSTIAKSYSYYYGDYHKKKPE